MPGAPVCLYALGAHVVCLCGRVFVCCLCAHVLVSLCVFVCVRSCVRSVVRALVVGGGGWVRRATAQRGVLQLGDHGVREERGVAEGSAPTPEDDQLGRRAGHHRLLRFH